MKATRLFLLVFIFTMRPAPDSWAVPGAKASRAAWSITSIPKARSLHRSRPDTTLQLPLQIGLAFVPAQYGNSQGLVRSGTDADPA